MIPALTPTDALIIVDVQNDFMPTGSLPVPGGDAILPAVNAWIDAAVSAGALVVVSRDWHPPDHSSFKENGGFWPAHCVQGTPGADFHPDMRVPPDAMLVTKGDRPELDQYSDFEQTTLAIDLRERGVKRVLVCGLAQDVCVKATVLDALKHGFITHVIASGTRALGRESGEESLKTMRRAGARIEG